jgi:hypothetical protein
MSADNLSTIERILADAFDPSRLPYDGFYRPVAEAILEAITPTRERGSDGAPILRAGVERLQKEGRIGALAHTESARALAHYDRLRVEADLAFDAATGEGRR